VPETEGGEVFAGGTPVTTAEAAELALLEPALLEPVTATRIVEPTSAEVSA
jgi:hypothetical protein